MVSGRNALSSIEKALADVRHEEAAVNDRLSQATEKLAAIQAEQTDAYQDLARFRLDDNAGEALRGRLDGSARRARKLLRERKDNTVELTKRHERIEADLEKLTALRASHMEKLEKASEKLEAASETAGKALEDNTDWKRQRDATEHAVSVIEAAETKAETAEADRIEKGEPYEDDVLFMYLWQRGYGTSRYKAGNIARMLDGWVAGLIRYHNARPNYAMLTEIPVRLREHVDYLKERAAEEVEKLKDIEETALAAAGGGGLNAELTKIRSDIDAFDKRFGELNGELDRIRDEETRFAGGEDDAYNEVIAALGDSLKDDDTKRLWKQAFDTPSPEDEKIVERIEQSYDDMHEVEQEIERGRKELRRLSRRREELTEVAGNFRRRHYDDYGSEFVDDAIIGSVLGEFLKGAMSGRDYWRRIERGHRQRGPRGGRAIGGGFPGFPSGGGWSGGGGGGGGGGGDGFTTGETF